VQPRNPLGHDSCVSGTPSRPWAAWSAGGAARREATRRRTGVLPKPRAAAPARDSAQPAAPDPALRPQLQPTKQQPASHAGGRGDVTCPRPPAQSVAVAPAPPTAAGRATSPRAGPVATAREGRVGRDVPAARSDVAVATRWCCPRHARPAAGPADTQRRGKNDGGALAGGDRCRMREGPRGLAGVIPRVSQSKVTLLQLTISDICLRKKR
jgi:hypothetical protein